MAESIKPLSSAAVLPHRPYTTNSRRVCGWDVARNVSQSANIKLSPDAVNMQCPLSVASYLWMREIDKIAKKDLGSSISEVIHYGTYSCRKQNGNTSGQWSEHAFANAWDVAGFKLKNGSVITVKNGWDDDSAEAQFLRRTRDTACKIFNVTLSPDFNAAHADHFHLDMGPTRTCR